MARLNMGLDPTDTEMLDYIARAGKQHCMEREYLGNPFDCPEYCISCPGCTRKAAQDFIKLQRANVLKEITKHS